jgi:hypothetical protein
MKPDIVSVSDSKMAKLRVKSKEAVEPKPRRGGKNVGLAHKCQFGAHN